MRVIFDIECNGLLQEATRIHCLSYYDLDRNVSGNLVDYSEITKFVMQENLTLIGHNIVRFDVPMLNKILEIDVKAALIDTLPLSWTLFPQYKKHGLETWGEYFGVFKPEIKDWNDLSVQEYVHRCEEDVKINTKLWKKQYHLLDLLYKDEKEIYRYCAYLSFKMDCVREQEETGIKLNIDHCEKMLATLSIEKEQKVEQLKAVMPKNPIKKKKTYENALIDKDGNLFQKGDLFFNQIETEANVSTIQKEKIIGHEEPNPNSPEQIKNWLYSLGWIPENIKHTRNKETNEVKKIPQVTSKFVQGEVCESVKKLFDKEPKLELLNGLSILSHRIGIFKAFLEDNVLGRLYPTCMGLTNTLRLQHAIVVNLPGIDKAYGKDIRSCLVADEGKMLCGSDLSGIEDSTKRHYIYKYDPEYVEEMNVPGYDGHLDIAVLAGMLTKEQAEDHKAGRANYKAIRFKAKQVNFSATYKVGAATLARNMNVSEREAKKLLDVYWQRNSAILRVEKYLKVKEIFGQKWILNPVSGFWYTLRSDKDKFSTLNQGTAVYVFDKWLGYIRKQGIKVSLQYHDEWLANVENEEETRNKIDSSIELLNNELKLNVKIGCSADFGTDYSQTH